MFRDEKLISGFTCSGHGPADSLPHWWLLYIVELQVPYLEILPGDPGMVP